MGQSDGDENLSVSISGFAAGAGGERGWGRAGAGAGVAGEEGLSCGDRGAGGDHGGGAEGRRGATGAGERVVGANRRGGIVWSKAGLAKRALAAYERAAGLDARNADARVALVQVYSQAPFFAGGDRAEAYASARELAAPDAWRGNFRLMRMHLEDKEPAEAFKACEALLRAEPESYRALYQLGRMVALTGQQRERGVAALRRALTLTPGADDPKKENAYNRLGQILEASGDVAGARAAYDSALALDPKLEDAKARRAKLK